MSYWSWSINITLLDIFSEINLKHRIDFFFPETKENNASGRLMTLTIAAT